MLPTRQQVEEKLSSLGYKAYGHFFGQPTGWFKIYINENLKTHVRMRFVYIPEINLGPYLILGFISGEGLSHMEMSFVGLETLRIEREEDLPKVDEFIDNWHYLLAYQQPWYFQDTKYDPGYALYKEGWVESKRHWLQKTDQIKDEISWERWRKTLTSHLSKSADSSPAGK